MVAERLMGCGGGESEGTGGRAAFPSDASERSGHADLKERREKVSTRRYISNVCRLCLGEENQASDTSEMTT